jgi:hypothetical protein
VIAAREHLGNRVRRRIMSGTVNIPIAGEIVLQQGGAMAERPDERLTADLPRGIPVEVANRFTGAWTPGFSVEAATENGYVVRRVSDGAVLPSTFDREAVRQTQGGSTT